MTRAAVFTCPSVALTVPAVRMLAVAVWASPDEDTPAGWRTDVEICPVVAISAVVEEDGGVGYHPLVLSPDTVWGVLPVDQALGDINGAYQVVTAPWTPEEDDARLAGLTTALRGQAIRNVAKAFSTMPAL